MNQITKVGIIGCGAFGSLLARILGEHVRLVVYDNSKSRRDEGVSGIDESAFVDQLSDLVDCQLICIATEVASLEYVCTQLKKIVQNDMVVMDVCSVKVEPVQIMKKVLGGTCTVVATHPLFGPSTVAKNGGSVVGQKMVWHHVSGHSADSVRNLFEVRVGLEVTEVDPETHDREMAWVHGLTFFVGKALLEMGPPSSELGTHYYQKLLDLVAVEKSHSDALFMTIQQGNPYTEEVRQAFIQKTAELNQKINGDV